jgi:hypothetical protein
VIWLWDNLACSEGVNHSHAATQLRSLMAEKYAASVFRIPPTSGPVASGPSETKLVVGTGTTRVEEASDVAGNVVVLVVTPRVVLVVTPRATVTVVFEARGRAEVVLLRGAVARATVVERTPPVVDALEKAEVLVGLGAEVVPDIGGDASRDCPGLKVTTRTVAAISIATPEPASTAVLRRRPLACFGSPALSHSTRVCERGSAGEASGAIIGARHLPQNRPSSACVPKEAPQELQMRSPPSLTRRIQS